MELVTAEAPNRSRPCIAGFCVRYQEQIFPHLKPMHKTEQEERKVGFRFNSKDPLLSSQSSHHPLMSLISPISKRYY